jgi:DNA modification methylase
MPYTLHRGDALTALAAIRDSNVDALITDPPYNSGGRTSSDRTGRSARAQYSSADAEHDLANFPDENRDQRSYGVWLTFLLTESCRATVGSGTALVFTDWRLLPTTTDALQAAGWTWRGIASCTRRSRVCRRAASSSPARTSSGEPRARATPTGTPSTCPASTPRASSGRTVYTSRRSPSR